VALSSCQGRFIWCLVAWRNGHALCRINADALYVGPG